MTRPTLDVLRLKDGTLPPVVWPGGYPIIYLDKGGITLCAVCANEDEVHGSPAVTWFIHYEGPPVICQGCSVGIESAYGDPDVDRNLRSAYGNPEADPFEGYHGPSADDGTKMPEIILGKLDTAPSSALIDQKIESAPRKAYMSVDRNFRVTIHEGNDDGVS